MHGKIIETNNLKNTRLIFIYLYTSTHYWYCVINKNFDNNKIRKKFKVKNKQKYTFILSIRILCTFSSTSQLFSKDRPLV